MSGERVLFITSVHPGGGGVVGAGEGISGDCVRALVTSGCQVHVVCFPSAQQAPNPEVVALCASYRVFEQTICQSLLGVLAGWRRGGLFAPWLFTRCSPRHRAIVRAEFATQRYERVWIDFPSVLGFAPELIGAEIDYFVHDVVGQKIGRRPLLSAVAPLVRWVEKGLLAGVRRCYVLSGKDRGLLRAEGFPGEIVVSPPRSVRAGVVTGGRSAASLVQQLRTGRSLVFFGNMQRAENHWSMMNFMTRTFPRIRKAHPDVRLWVVGLRPRRALRWCARLIGGVEVVGAVDDPLPVLRAATLCVAPLSLGAGVKIKVLQMLEAGAVVVATSVAAEGIEPHERLLVADGDQFAVLVCQLLADAGSPALPAST